MCADICVHIHMYMQVEPEMSNYSSILLPWLRTLSQRMQKCLVSFAQDEKLRRELIYEDQRMYQVP